MGQYAKTSEEEERGGARWDKGTLKSRASATKGGGYL